MTKRGSYLDQYDIDDSSENDERVSYLDQYDIDDSSKNYERGSYRVAKENRHPPAHFS